MKKVLSLLLVLAMLMGAMPVFAAGEDVSVTVNGAALEFDVPPRIEDGRTLVPLRAIFEALDATVDWDDTTKTVTATRGNSEISLTIGEKIITVNGEDIELDVPAKIVDSRTLVPVRAVSESLDATVDWDNDSRTVIIISTAADKYADKFFVIINAASGEALNAADTESETGIRLLTKEADESDAQIWRFKRIGANMYSLINKETGIAADVNSVSYDAGASIIQWKATGATNQTFILAENGDGTVSLAARHSGLTLEAADGLLTQEESTGEDNQKWTLEYVGDYTSILTAALSSDAYKGLDPYIRTRIYDMLNSPIHYSTTVADKAEEMLIASDFENNSYDEQQENLLAILDITYADLLAGSMAYKETPEYTIEGPTVENVIIWLSEEDRYDAYAYHITYASGTDEESEVMFYTVDEGDEEYAERVAQAIGAFPYPVRKQLNRFYYTGYELGSWNGGGGGIWNNTGYKGDVNNMVQMFAHELGHVMDNGAVGSDNIWYRAIARDMIGVTGYGNTNKWEDLAEFSRAYLLARGDDGQISALHQMFPNRAEAYEAVLYAHGGDYFADFADEYERATASIGDAGDLDITKYYKIESEYGALTANEDGTVTVEEYVGGANQMFQAQSTGDAIELISSDGLYIDLDDDAQSAPFIAKEDGATAFALTKEGDGFLMRPVWTGFYLTAEGGSAVQKVNDKCVWRFEEVGEVAGAGYYRIFCGAGYLGIRDNSEERAARLAICDRDDTRAQEWLVYPVGDSVVFINMLTGYAMDVNGGSVDEGAEVIVWTLTKAANQRWEMDGSGTIRSLNSGLYLMVDDDGESVVQGSTAAVWQLEKIEK